MILELSALFSYLLLSLYYHLSANYKYNVQQNYFDPSMKSQEKKLSY